MEKVQGIGGVFFKAKDPKALAQWYREHLGVPVEPDQTYATLMSEGAGEMAVWSTFPDDSDYLGRPEQQFMVNFRVGDLKAMLKQLRDAGVRVDEKTEEFEYGHFGWATDPEGNRIELWQPMVPEG
jgi:predicted enzyme related to lactoylglutathione lyase